MKPDKIKELLKEELEYKKGYTAKWNGTCDGCGNQIAEGEDFIFMGSKQKICGECQAQIIEFLEA